VTDRWHTNDLSFFEKLSPQDNIWIIIRASEDDPNEWRLLERLKVAQMLPNHDEKYGEYCALGDILNSEFYSIDRQHNFEPIIHRLEFESGKEIPAHVSANKIGIYIQGVRWLSDLDTLTMQKYARSLNRLLTFDRNYSPL
jgi:hypothetical protein